VGLGLGDGIGRNKIGRNGIGRNGTEPFPPPHLLSPKFPQVPLGVGGWSLGCEEQRCWAIGRAISFKDFQPV